MVGPDGEGIIRLLDAGVGMATMEVAAVIPRDPDTENPNAMVGMEEKDAMVGAMAAETIDTKNPAKVEVDPGPGPGLHPLPVEVATRGLNQRAKVEVDPCPGHRWPAGHPLPGRRGLHPVVPDQGQ